MKQVAGHPHNLSFHLADIWKDIGMQRIGPRKLGIHLNNQSELSMYLTQPTRTLHASHSQSAQIIHLTQSNKLCTYIIIIP